MMVGYWLMLVSDGQCWLNQWHPQGSALPSDDQEAGTVPGYDRTSYNRAPGDWDRRDASWKPGGFVKV